MSKTIQPARRAAKLTPPAKPVFKTLPPGTSPASTRSRADRQTARRMLDLLKKGEDVRFNKTRRVRSAIHAGKYENDLKLQVAVDRLLEELLK